MQVPQDREAEGSVTSPELSTHTCITLFTNSDPRPLASSFSSSISCLTDLSEGEDTDGLVSDACVESDTPLLVDNHRHGFLWEAREPTISDDDVEETPSRLPLAIENDSDVGLAPVTDSIDDLVALFAALRVSRVVPSAPQQVRPASVLPAPLQLVVDVPASQEVIPPVELQPTSSLLIEASHLPVANVVQHLNEEEDDDSDSEVWFDTFDVSDDEDEIWFDCVETFEPVVEVVEVSTLTSTPAQPVTQEQHPECVQPRSKILPGGLYDHDEELGFDPSGHLEALCVYLVTCVFRASKAFVCQLATYI